ncbi:hypothetical protein SmJEL517_g01541 [Synchytrium microbalum]|uniref:Uncharacterized protein n=1 Tax=Synchytrium microbalum TaxID=1806994 RepID=A0A507C9F2_9FUNG|nr:uncharacterized protein SmJEL517_g01541 [Synchytrium microbalum]TPX36232.1 hypothetical protein SmJEL517_g01541 [Synchytrium microbalum]
MLTIKTLQFSLDARTYTLILLLHKSVTTPSAPLASWSAFNMIHNLHPNLALAGTSKEVYQHTKSCPFEGIKGYILLNEARIAKLEAKIVAQSREIEDLRNGHTSLTIPSPPPLTTTTSSESVNEIPIWPTGDIRCRRTILDHRTGVTSLAYYEGIIFSGSYDGSMKAFDAETGQLKRTMNGHNLSVWALATHAASNRLFSGGSDGTVKAWALNSNTSNEEPKGIDTSGAKVYSLAIAKNRLFTASSDKTIKVYDIETLNKVATFIGHADGVNALKMLGGDRLASAASDKTIKIWDLNTGTTISTMSDTASEVLDLSHDGGQMLFSSSYDSNIAVYNLNDYSRIRTLSGHQWEVWQLQYTDGALFSSSHDHTVKRWDVRMTFLNDLTLKGHKGFVHALCIGNRELLSGGADKTIRIWR